MTDLEKGLVAGVIAILLGLFAVFVGWTIIGSLWGLIALLLAIYSYRKGHRMLGTLGILFACVGLIEGILVAGIVALFSVLTTSANTGIETTPSSPLTVSKIYSLRVLEVIVDKVYDIDYDYFILMIEAAYNGRESWDFSTSKLYLVSDKGYKYSSSYSPAIRYPLSFVELKNGEATKGQVAFKLPKGEKPSKLICDDEYRRIKVEVADIPSPSRQVSWIYSLMSKVRSEYSYISAYASMDPYRTTFYSGEEIKVKLEISYRASTFEKSPKSITVTSITIDKFEIVEINPQPPITLKDGDRVTIELVMKVPEEGYKGNPIITIIAE
jgi:hypothetical protein